MTTELSEDNVAACSNAETYNLAVSIIYDEASSGARARKSLDNLAGNLKLEGDVFKLRMWSLDLLSEPVLRSAAAREAGGYDIVFLSMRDGGEPSPVLKEWLGEWMKCRSNHPCALAVMVEKKEGMASGNTPLLNYLANMAQAGELDLVYPCSDTPAQPAEQEDVRHIAQRAINASPLLEGILDDWESYSHSGINE